MTESQINCFIKSAMHGSFSAAAAEMYITQPGVSKQVSSLENELGFPLFFRSPSGLVLTPAGTMIYDFLCNYRRELSMVLERARRVSMGEKNSLRIGCMEGWDLSRFYPQLLDCLQHERPDLAVSVDCYSYSALVQALKSGKVDIILSYYNQLMKYTEFNTWKLMSIGSILSYSARHPLAKKPDLCMQDFAMEQFFSIGESDTTHAGAMIRRCCARYGFTPRITDLENVSSASAKLQGMEGVVLTDEWMLFSSTPGLKNMPVMHEYDIGLSWMDDFTGAVGSQLINTIVDFFVNQLN